MQFLVEARGIEGVNVPPQAAIALAKRTFEMLVANQEPRVKHVYSFAGERAGVLIIEVNSAEELQEVIGSLPFAPIVRVEIHPIGSLEAALKTIRQVEANMAQMMPVGAGAN